MSVTSLEQFKSRETVELLEKLLSRAKQGKVKGLLFCVQMQTGKHAMGLSGSYLEDPVTGLVISSRLQHKLNLKIDQLRRDSDYAELKTQY